MGDWQHLNRGQRGGCWGPQAGVTQGGGSTQPEATQIVNSSASHSHASIHSSACLVTMATMPSFTGIREGKRTQHSGKCPSMKGFCAHPLRSAWCRSLREEAA